MPVVVSIDVGTSAVRAALVDLHGAVLSGARVARRGPADGELFEADAMVGDVMAALAQLQGAGAATALAVSAHLGVVPVDATGTVLDRAGGWSDPRGLDRLGRLDRGQADSLLRTSGRPALGSSALAYALHLAAEPSLRARVRHLLSPTGLIVRRLTGATVTDTVNAAYTLLFDVVGRGWHEDALVALGLDPQWFPPPSNPADVVGRVSADAARLSGLPVGLPVVAGGPDGSVGAGLLLGDDTSLVADVAGTTDVLARLVDHPGDAPRGTVVNPALTGRGWTAGGPTGMTGGAVAGWRRLLVPVPEQTLAAVEPGAGGLVVVPAQTGSRFPRWRPDERGAVLGQRPEHDAAQLLRASQEGAAFTVREAVDLLDPGSRAPVVLAGGTARTVSAAQLRADVLGRTTLVSREPDVTLLGAAALAMIGAGLVGSLAEARHLVGPAIDVLEPDPIRTARYAELFVAWRAARDGLDRARPRPEPSDGPSARA